MSRVPRTDRLTTLWLVASVLAGAATLAGGLLPQPLWTMIHVVTLGVLSNGILQWSWYFCRALLRLPVDDRRAGRDNTIRILALNAALAVLIASMWGAWAPGAVAGATLVGVVAAWHGLALVVAARSRLASRFAVVIRYYAAAAAFLVLACALAGFVTVAMFEADAPAWLLAARDRLTVAHALAAAGGWVGLTIGGTVITLGPTAIRTRIAPGAVQAAMLALPAWVLGLLVAVGGALAEVRAGISLGLLIVVVAAGVGVALPLARAALAKGPAEYGAWSLCLGVAWVLVSVAALAVTALLHGDAAALRSANLAWLPVLGLGGLGQVFIGALVYLMPVVIGGGPAAVRHGVTRLEAWAPTREAVRNAAVLLLAVAALTGVEALAPLARVLILVGYLVDIALLALVGVSQSRLASASRTGGPHA